VRCDLNANEGLEQGNPGALAVDVDDFGGQPLFGALPSGLRPADIDVLRPFSDLREHGDAIG
jgi:hypothetical protein